MHSFFRHQSSPLFLTWIRLVGSITVIPLFFLMLLPQQRFLFDLVCTCSFFFLSITDFFDGQLARRYGNATSFGAFLDPIADKFLLFSSLICLLSVGRVFAAIVLILLLRELLIVSLRQYAGETGKLVPVSRGGKLKTVVLSAAILCATAHAINPIFTILSSVLFIFGACISGVSGIVYIRQVVGR